MLRVTPRRHALLLAAGFGMGGSIFGTAGYLHDPDKAILWEAWPANFRAALWLIMGALVLVGAFSHRLEVAAFALAVVMPFERAIGPPVVVVAVGHPRGPGRRPARTGARPRLAVVRRVHRLGCHDRAPT